MLQTHECGQDMPREHGHVMHLKPRQAAAKGGQASQAVAVVAASFKPQALKARQPGELRGGARSGQLSAFSVPRGLEVHLCRHIAVAQACRHVHVSPCHPEHSC